jgi:hypothetical protein
MTKENLTKAFRFIIGIGVISLIIYSLTKEKNYSSYSSDASYIEAEEDRIKYNQKIELDYKNSLEGKYDNKEQDTTFTENGDMVIFYVSTDTIKRKK